MKVLSLVLETSEQATLPVQPRKEPFHHPASLIATQSSTILRLFLYSPSMMWRDHLYAFLSRCFIQFVRVIRTITDQVFRLRFDYVKVKNSIASGPLHDDSLHACSLLKAGRDDPQSP